MVVNIRQLAGALGAALLHSSALAFGDSADGLSETVDLANADKPGNTVMLRLETTCLEQAGYEDLMLQEINESSRRRRISEGLKRLKHRIAENLKTAIPESPISLMSAAQVAEPLEYEYLRNVDVLLVKNNRSLVNNEVMLNALQNIPCVEGEASLESLRAIDVNASSMFRVVLHPRVQANRKHNSLACFGCDSLSNATLPNDPKLSEQWYMFGPQQGEKFGINAIEAWAAMMRDAAPEEAAERFVNPEEHLEPTVVAVVDSGCNIHDDLADSLAYAAQCSSGQKTYYDATTRRNKGCFGYSFGDDRPDPSTDIANHGTAAAGLIAARVNNGKGIAGICPSCRLLCLNIVNSSTRKIATSAIVKAIDYIIENKIKVSNHSYGGFGSDPTELHAFRKLNETGMHLAFTAAGNASCNIGCRNATNCPRKCKNRESWTPAEFPFDNLFVVGSVDRTGRVASYSNIGDNTVDMFAPGTGIISLSNTSKSKFVIVSGTSFSSPIAAAAGALLWSSVPHAQAWQIREALAGGATLFKHLTYYSRVPGVINLQRSYALLKQLAAQAET